jgi:lipopolysaccharide export system permease protein
MRLHDRYFFRELITPLAFCLGAFLILGISLFFEQQINTIHERKLSGLETIEYCAASLPEFFVLILPILLLLALLYALTHHARHNEITALRAAGVGLWRLCAPYFITGLAATGVYFAINEITVPACNRWTEEILNRHVQKDPDTPVSPQAAKTVSNRLKHRIWRFVQFDEKTSLMQNPTVSWSLPDKTWRALQASSGLYSNGVWTFFNVIPFAEPPGQFELKPAGFTNLLAVPEFDETPGQLLLLLKFTDSQTLHSTGSTDIPLSELWDLLKNKSYLLPADANAVETKFHGRIAMPWTCFIVVLMAIPFGAPSGRRNLFFGVAGSIFIGFAYFVLERVSLALGINGQLPGWLAAWLPNMIFAFAGTVLTLRVR